MKKHILTIALALTLSACAPLHAMDTKTDLTQEETLAFNTLSTDIVPAYNTIVQQADIPYTLKNTPTQQLQSCLCQFRTLKHRARQRSRLNTSSANVSDDTVELCRKVYNLRNTIRFELAHSIIHKGDANTCKYSSEEQSAPLQCESFSDRPLTIPLALSDAPLLILLLKHGADPQKTISQLRPALFLARTPIIAKILHFYGAPYEPIRKIVGLSPLHCAMSPAYTPKIVQFWMDQGADPHAINLYGATPFKTLSAKEPSYINKDPFYDKIDILDSIPTTSRKNSL